MLQRLAQFGVAFLQFFEQANVLDGDYRLGGKGFEQFDLLVGERTNFHSTDVDHTNRESLL